MIAQALCPTCGRMPRMVQDRGGVWVLDRHDWRRGVPCPGAGLTWREIERQAIATGPARIPTGLLGGAA